MKEIAIEIYMHTNTITGEVYIGQSSNIGYRWQSNGKEYKQSTKFYKAIQTYGLDNFKHEIIDHADNEIDANILEHKYIQKYNSIKSGYNVDKAGFLWRNNFDYTPEMKSDNRNNVYMIYKYIDDNGNEKTAIFRSIKQLFNKNLVSRCLYITTNKYKIAKKLKTMECIYA